MSTPAPKDQTAERRPRNPRGQGNRLREELLDAADAILAATGDAQTLSLRSVAKQVGIAATSVYLHFPDIDDLKIALAQRGFAELDHARAAASRDLTDPLAMLLARIRAYVHYALDYPGRYRLMFGPDLPATLTYAAVDSPSRQALASLAQSIQRCQDAHLARNSDVPLTIAMEVWAAIHGVILLRIERPNLPWPPLDEMVDAMVLRLIGALAGTDSPAQ